MHRIYKLLSPIIVAAIIGLFSLQGFAKNKHCSAKETPPHSNYVCCHGKWKAKNDCKPASDKDDGRHTKTFILL